MSTINGDDKDNNLVGTALADVISGGKGNDTLDGAEGNDALDGGEGNDKLNGGTGADKMVGGNGDDDYTIDNAGDVVTEKLNGGYDTVTFADSALVSKVISNVEGYIYTGTKDWTFTGDAADNFLKGSSGNDTLSGGAGNDALNGGTGNDKLAGGTGDDSYVIDSAGDVVTEKSGEGADTVYFADQALVTKMISNVESYVYTGTDDWTFTGDTANNTLKGGSGNDTLNGGGGNDLLDGGSGADKLTGGTGDDIYVVDDAADVVTEKSSEGFDTVYFNDIAHVPTLISNVEGYVYTGTKDWTFTGDTSDNYLKGGSGNDTLSGGDGNDILDGGAGIDALTGGKGNDTYILDNAGDTFTELPGEGIDTVQYGLANIDLNDSKYASIENATLSGNLALNLTGTSGDNVLVGNAAANIIIGGDGNDKLDGGAGIDKLDGGSGNDIYVIDVAGDKITDASGTDEVQSATLSLNLATLSGGVIENATLLGAAALNAFGNTGSNVLTGNDGDNYLDGGAGDDTLSGGKGNDTLVGGAGNDEMTGGTGNDIYVFDSAGDKAHESVGGGTGDEIYSTNKSLIALTTNIENYYYAGKEDWTFVGDTGNNLIVGGSGINNLHGDAGADTLYGGAKADTIFGDAGNDVLRGGDGNDTLTGGSNDDDLSGGAGNDIMDGGTGSDYYTIEQIGDTIIGETAGSGTQDTIRTVLELNLNDAKWDYIENILLYSSKGLKATGDEGANIIYGSLGNDTIVGGAGNDTLLSSHPTYNTLAGGSDKISGDAGNDTIIGGAGNDTILGGADNDTLTGGLGNDSLDGGTGIDAMTGGFGDDSYVVDNVGDTVIETATGGTDKINSSIDFDLSVGGANVENLTLTGTGNINATGSGTDNILTGNSGDNVLNGGAGKDTMIGGAGNDTYIVDNVGDKVTETLAGAAGGVDLVKSGIDFNLTALANIENLTLTGTAVTGTGNALNNSITGNASANTLNGGAGDDTLDGGLGADQLFGGAGNDTYVIDDAGDVVTEKSGEGSDTVASANDALLTKLISNVENYTYTGSNNWTFTGDAANNTLKGGSGADTLNGGIGNDVLDGGTGADQLTGGVGNDSYYIDDTGDVVAEQANEGIDTVYTSIDLNLATKNWDAIESVIVTDTGDHVITGNDLNNSLTGGIGNDTLDGGVGVDTLKGGKGDDGYIVDLIAAGGVAKLQDTVTENLDEGSDTIILRTAGDLGLTKATTLILGANIENLDASSTGNNMLNLTGNALDNKLTGNDADNVLDGGLGADTLSGGAGNDIYIVDQSDTVHEVTGEGIDTVKMTATVANLTFDMATKYENVENFTLLGALAGNITGNDLANTLTGNAASNILDGGLGADKLIGGAGNDTYVVDDAGDVVTEKANEGNDTLVSAKDTLLILTGNVENYTYTGSDNWTFAGDAANNTLKGSSGADTLDGGIGNDTLDGGTGADKLTGGAGNDIYYVDDAADTVTEAAKGGTDTVYASVDYTLQAGQEVENIIVSGNTGLNIHGNELNNTITGGGGGDVLDGGGGNDTLIGGEGSDQLSGNTGIDILKGGKGDDIYDVDLVAVGTTSVKLEDTVTENAGEGTDTLVLHLVTDLGHASATTLVLGANLENLDASDTGLNKLNLTGNALGNFLTGNDAVNILDGGAGNDTLDGGHGADTLKGGAGSDTFHYGEVADGGTGEIITDFQKGAGGDVLDLHDVLQGFAGYDGTNAFTGGFLKFEDDTHGGTKVLVDADGGGDNYVELVTVTKVTLTEADTINIHL